MLAPPLFKIHLFTYQAGAIKARCGGDQNKPTFVHFIIFQIQIRQVKKQALKVRTQHVSPLFIGELVQQEETPIYFPIQKKK